MKKESLWSLAYGFGILLAMAPSLVFMANLLLSSEEPDFVAPLIQYIGATVLAVVIGYFFMRKGLQEQERSRVKKLVREVIDEIQKEQVKTRPTDNEDPASRAVPDGWVHLRDVDLLPGGTFSRSEASYTKDGTRPFLGTPRTPDDSKT